MLGLRLVTVEILSNFNLLICFSPTYQLARPFLCSSLFFPRNDFKQVFLYPRMGAIIISLPANNIPKFIEVCVSKVRIVSVASQHVFLNAVEI